MTKILITGGSGLVGTALTEKLIEKGYKINWLSRSKKSHDNVKTYQWDSKKNYIDKKAFDGVDCIVHLAGANIFAKAWSNDYKETIYNSRIKTSQLLFEYVKEYNIPINTFISASATGFYGTFTSEKVLTEDDPAGNDFLAKVCIDWEKKAEQFTKIDVRTVAIRNGIVFSKEGGALPRIIKPIKLGVGASLGSGKQYMPWIHIDDLVRIYIRAIEDKSMSGYYNATTPESITNQEITRQLAQQLNKPLWLPNIPSIVLRTILGKRAKLLLEGTHIYPKRLIKNDFEFKYPTFLQTRKALF